MLVVTVVVKKIKKIFQPVQKYFRVILFPREKCLCATLSPGAILAVLYARVNIIHTLVYM